MITINTNEDFKKLVSPKFQFYVGNMKIHAIYNIMTNRIKNKYGDNTVILFQIGDFYQMYSDDKNYDYFHEVCNMCNLFETRLSKKREHNNNNPHMAGFPLYRVDHYVKILLKNNKKVALFKQIKQSGGKILRTLDKLLSQGTFIENESIDNNNNGIIYCVCDDILALTYINIGTGAVKLCEIYPKNDKYEKYDKAFGFILSNPPAEFIFMNNSKELSRDIIKKLKLDELDIQYEEIKCIDDVSYRKNISYQTELLNKIYCNKSLVSPIEYLNIEKYDLARFCFISLIEYLIDFGEDIVMKLKNPIVCNNSENNKVYIDFSTISDLNIINTGRKQNESIFKIINNTKTQMGKRLLKERILNPIKSITELNDRYQISKKLCGKENEYKLKNIFDIEKLHRKIELCKIRPSEYYQFYTSIKLVKKCLSLAKKHNLFDPSNLINDIEKYEKYIAEIFLIKEFEKYGTVDKIDGIIFTQNCESKVDTLIADIKKIDTEMKTNYLDKINNKYKNINATIKYTVQDGHYIHISSKSKYKKLVKKGFILKFTVKELKTNVKLSHPKLRNLSDKMLTTKEKIYDINKKCVYKYMVKANQFLPNFNYIVKYISIIDIGLNNLTLKNNHKYTCPKLSKDCNIDAVGIRHPIVETNSSELFVTNGIYFDNNNKNRIIYGYNGSGKSVYIKSIPVCVILAQAGIYVPARKFVFSPFDTIITRIRSKDNLCNGVSTFTNEILNLSTIFTRMNNNSLIIMDELLTGTEYYSSLALVANTLKKLNRQQCCYLLASHKHELVKILSNTAQNKFYHFSTQIKNNNMIHDRKLQKGKPNTKLYGIEVAKIFINDNKFISESISLRNKLVKKYTFVEALVNSKGKKSRYNTKKLVFQCEYKNCDATEDLHTHHINEQHTADKFGMIKNKHFHKNAVHNLQTLCKKHHQFIHSTL